MGVDDLAARILEFRSFYRRGGVTLSGGEPFAQPAFAAALLRRLKAAGLHTAVDTAGSIPLEQCREAVDLADLILLDIKALSPEQCRKLTGADGSGAKALIEYCQQHGKPVWLRHVLIPGHTLVPALLEQLAVYLKPYTCIERVELLPFHQMGAYKWEELGLFYPMAGVDPPSPQEVEQAREIFRCAGFTVC